MEDSIYAWKELATGRIVQYPVAKTKEQLFEMTGFGAVNMDVPIKGCLAVKVKKEPGSWVEK